MTDIESPTRPLPRAEVMQITDIFRAKIVDVQPKSLVIEITGAESKVENIIAAKQAGVNNYIVKPFNAITLKEKLTAVIGSF